MHLGDNEYMVLRLALELQKVQCNEDIAKNGESKVAKDALKQVQEIENSIKDGAINLTLEQTEALYSYIFVFREITRNMNADDKNDTESRNYVIAATNILNRLERLFNASGIKISDFMTLHQSKKSFNEAVNRTNGKVGRNSPCPCGSGKKYKYCCGK